MTCVDDTNKTVIAVYTGDPNDVLGIGDGTGDVVIPDGYKYTMIFIGGVHINIEDNIVYPDPNQAVIILTAISKLGIFMGGERRVVLALSKLEASACDHIIVRNSNYSN